MVRYTELVRKISSGRFIFGHPVADESLCNSKACLPHSRMTNEGTASDLWTEQARTSTKLLLYKRHCHTPSRRSAHEMNEKRLITLAISKC